MKLRTTGLGAAALVVAAGFVMAGGELPGKPDVDTSERRKYTLVADVNENEARAIIDVHVSSARGLKIDVKGRRVTTTWKTDVWVEAGDVVTIVLNVATYGQHALGIAPWSRCQIMLNDGMTGGDVEIWQVKMIQKPEDQMKQAHAKCSIQGG